MYKTSIKIKYVLTLIFLIYLSIPIYSQSPGGLTNVNVEYWLKADNIDIEDNTDITSWLDVSGNNRNFIAAPGNQYYPRLNLNSMNFNPSVDFYFDENISNTNNARRKLVSENIFEPNPNKSYFTIWISKLNTEYTSSYSTVFALNATTATGGTGNLYGWRSTGILWHHTSGANYAHSVSSKTYGIGISIQPNNTTTPQQQYLNGITSQTSMPGRLLTTNARESVFGTTSTGTGNANFFNGEILELIVLSKDGTGQTLSPDELNLINSHFAIKYGITTAQSEYKFANGSIIYKVDQPGYENYNQNIFGIAREDASGLHQKQSFSSDKGELTVFIGDLANTNKENTSTLNNNTALVLGSNNLDGYREYQQGFGTSFQNYTLQNEERLNTIYNNTFRARVTGQDSFTVSLKTSIGEWVVISNTETFEPASTRIYKSIGGIVKDVLINDGEYISFVSFNESPGGIGNTNIVYWLRADDLSNFNDGEDVNLWKDITGKNFTNTDNNPFFPRLVKSSMNFHSSVEFYNNPSSEGGPSLTNNRRRKLQSENLFSPDSDKSYFTIFISKLDQNNSSTYSNVFTLNASTASGGSSNSFGWANTGRINHYTNGTRYNHHSEGKNYGIGIVVQPNNTSTPQEQYFSGLKSTTAMSGRVMNSNARVSTIGTFASDSGVENYFFGEIMEVIVISRDGAGQVLTDDELKKINTHLAVKYGLTLSDTQKEYVLSNDNVIYDSNNEGYINYNKDIFGIARDDESGLYQKQSTSYENPSLICFLGELADNNESNSSTFPNYNALIFGANGSTGVSQYIHPVGTSFQNYTLTTHTDPQTGVVTEEKLSIIFNYKLRAKTTGANNHTVNFKPSQGEWLMISQDESFSPTNTRIYKIIDGEVNNVVVNDGDYIAFSSFLKAPAGVTEGLVMWLNASKQNTITLENTDDVVNWIDNSGFGTSFSKINSNSTAPKYVKISEEMNFHPAVEFKNRYQYLSTHKGPFTVAAPDDYTIFTALNANFTSQARLYFTSYGSLTRNIYPALGVVRSGDGTVGHARIYDGAGDGAVEGNLPLFKAGATTAMAHTMKKNSYFRLYSDGYVENINSTTAGRGSRMNGPGTLGYGGANDDRRLVGFIGEHIAYENDLSQENRDKIDGYLGLKYAITTDKNKSSVNENFTFKFSDNTNVWDGNDEIHQNYHNNIASVIRDDDTDLYNRQSRSTNVGSILHMGVGSKLGVSPILNDIIRDKSALTWGHNNAPVAETSLIGNPDICGEMDSRLDGRIWLVDNTNFNQEILVSAYGSEFPYNGSNFQVYLLLADSPEKLTNNNWDQIIPMTYSDDKHVLNYNFKDKYTYITFGAKVVGTCEGCTFSGVKKLDFDRSTWPTRGSLGPNTYNLGNDFNVSIVVEDPSNRMYNGYPRNYSRKSLIERRRGVEAITTKISFNNDSNEKQAASTTFEIFDIDRTGSRPDDIQVIGYCNGSPVYPKLNYIYNRPERGRYNIKQSGISQAKLRGERYSGNSGYTNNRGRMLVDFEYPVEEIHIVYKTNSTLPNLSTYIGIGPMEFYCPTPPPAPNEDGLVFTKQGSNEVLLCETIDYTFRAINTNCDEKPVVFTDTLPEGMIWINDSFTTFGYEQPNMVISGYGTRTLTVSGFNIPGGGSNYTFKASALFLENATAGVYENQAKLEYDRLGTQIELYSTDRLTGQPLTKTIALDSERPKQILANISLDKSCFKLDGEIEVTLKFNNLNSIAINDLFLETEYDDSAFTLVDGSIQYSPGLNMLLQKDQEEDVEGYLEAEEFSLPSGEHWVKFRVKASDDISNYEIDPETLEPTNLLFSFNLDTLTDDCLGSAMANANGEIELPFCTFCTQLPKGGSPGISNTGISVMKEQLTGWPENVANGYLVLEAGKRGMVITRTTPEAIGEANWVKGMIIFDISENKKCISIYNGTEWKCIERSCNE